MRLSPFFFPATDAEVEAAAAQFVRKVSGGRNPSRRNREAALRAVAEITASTRLLIDSLTTGAPPKNREEEAAKAARRAQKRAR